MTNAVDAWFQQIMALLLCYDCHYTAKYCYDCVMIVIYCIQPIMSSSDLFEVICGVTLGMICENQNLMTNP